MPADPNRVETIFAAALAVDPAARAAFLAAECSSDPELRARVERLLAAHADLNAPPATAPHAPDGSTGSFECRGERPGPTETEDHEPSPDYGTVIAGRYKLLEPIGEGGMGTVWMQQFPVSRKSR